ncbi:MAG: carboxypeptidase-like regulatory domain-containing protein, partial [Flavobacteriales bacterium]
MTVINPKLSILIFLLTTLLVEKHLNAQQLNWEAQVVDFETKETLPYANVYLLGSSTWGTVSDQNGQVLVKLNGFQKTDSLAFSFIGYETLTLSVLELKNRNIIELQVAENILNTLVLKPLSAEEYLKKCINYIPDNQPDTLFSTLSYYAEKGLENGE